MTIHLIHEVCNSLKPLYTNQQYRQIHRKKPFKHDEKKLASKNMEHLGVSIGGVCDS